MVFATQALKYFENNAGWLAGVEWLGGWLALKFQISINFSREIAMTSFLSFFCTRAPETPRDRRALPVLPREQVRIGEDVLPVRGPPSQGGEGEAGDRRRSAGPDPGNGGGS